MRSNGHLALADAPTFPIFGISYISYYSTQTTLQPPTPLPQNNKYQEHSILILQHELGAGIGYADFNMNAGRLFFLEAEAKQRQVRWLVIEFHAVLLILEQTCEVGEIVMEGYVWEKAVREARTIVLALLLKSQLAYCHALYRWCALEELNASCKDSVAS